MRSSLIYGNEHRIRYAATLTQSYLINHSQTFTHYNTPNAIKDYHDFY